MAMSKTTGATKGKGSAAPTKTALKAAPKVAKAAVKSAPKAALKAAPPAGKKSAPKVASLEAKKAAPQTAPVEVKKAAPKKAAAPKLSPTQSTLLEKIAGLSETGYLAESKPDQKTVDALLKHRLVKKGKKDEKTKNFFVLISQTGRKYLDTKAAAAKG